MIEQRTLQEQTNILANYLRNDPLHEEKNEEGSVLRRILEGLASQWNVFRSDLDLVVKEYNPTNTTKLIDEWEKFVGIPDSCIKKASTLEQRRMFILLKLAGINATTKRQFENVAKVLGYDVNVETGVDISGFPMTFPFILMNQGVAPFAIVVSLPASLKPSGFPLTFPFTLGDGVPSVLLCIFNKLKPANCVVYFRYR